MQIPALRCLPLLGTLVRWFAASFLGQAFRGRSPREFPAVNDDSVLPSGPFLTKTEAFVLECRSRGMSNTAIRRLLQLSAAEAAALGVIPSQASDRSSSETAGDTGQSSKSWPERQGRCRAHRRRAPISANSAKGSSRARRGWAQRRRQELSPSRQRASRNGQGI